MNAAVAWVMLALCVAMEIVRELCFKVALGGSETGRSLRMTLARPILWAGVAFWAIEVLVWIQVLARLPLGLAFPIMTLTYIGIPAASHWLLNERLRGSQWAGVGLVLVGVVLVGASGT